MFDVEKRSPKTAVRASDPAYYLEDKLFFEGKKMHRLSADIFLDGTNPHRGTIGRRYTGRITRNGKVEEIQIIFHQERARTFESGKLFDDMIAEAEDQGLTSKAKYRHINRRIHLEGYWEAQRRKGTDGQWSTVGWRFYPSHWTYQLTGSDDFHSEGATPETKTKFRPAS